MSPADCFFCGHPLQSAFAGDKCPNCGAPLTRRAGKPAGSNATQVLFPILWQQDLPAPAPKGTPDTPPKTAGLIGTYQEEKTSFTSESEAASAANHTASAELRSATLEGQVDTPPTKNVVDVPLEWWSQGALRMFFPVVFVMLSRYLLVAGPQDNGTPGPQPKPTMTVYTVRVRRDDQTLGEARLEGDLIEGEPSLGDRLLLHGHYRGNTLIVDEGYNYSFTPPMRIKVRPPIPRRRARIAVIVLSAALLLTTALLCSFFPLFAAHAGRAQSSSALQQVLLHYYLGAGIVLALLIFCLYALSGTLIRILMGLFVLVAGLAVYVALGGAGIPLLPFHI